VWAQWSVAVSPCAAPWLAAVGGDVRKCACGLKAVLTGPCPTPPPRCRRRPRLASRPPVPTAPSPMSEADHVTVRVLCLYPSVPPPLPGRLHRREPLQGERSPEHPPCRLFLRVHLRLSFLSLPTPTQDPASHQSPHLVRERRRRPSFSTLPVGKKLR
jgi:hypothetical protein